MRAWSLLAAAPVVAVLAAPVLAAPPVINARAWILVNPATEEVLAQRAPDRRLPMASTTKMMTAIVTMERAKLGDRVTVPAAAATPGGSSSGLVAGERIAVRTLLTGLMVGSGNDASVALATHVGGGSSARFVQFMNAEAQEMGLADTRFANPHGLDAAGHYSTVRDLIALGQRTLEFPYLRRTVANRVATIAGPNGVGTRKLESENDLLAIDRDADGIKTGHTAGAGYALVAHGRRQTTGVELYLAMIGSPGRTQRARDAKRLLDWGFAQYVRVTPLRADQVIVRVPVRDRPGVTVPLVVEAPLATTIKVGRRLTRTIVAPAELIPPVASGTSVGQVIIKDGNREIGKRALLVGEDVDGASLTEKIRSGVDRLT